jgi:hypothetical protein
MLALVARSLPTQYIYLYNACIATLLASVALVSRTLRLPCSRCSAASPTPRKRAG